MLLAGEEQLGLLPAGGCGLGLQNSMWCGVAGGRGLCLLHGTEVSLVSILRAKGWPGVGAVQSALP